jgi:CheY-like chemotaxis protein
MAGARSAADQSRDGQCKDTKHPGAGQPAAPPAASCGGRWTVLHYSMAHLLAGIRILVVEDNDDEREVLEQSLTSKGATVRAVPTALDALALLGDADIILTDFALPGNDGVWLLERVNKQPKPIPVIAMSGYDERQQPRLATAPFAGKLLKPYDFDQLCAEIAATSGRRA